jgi:uncharacterized protein (DUF885 family)
MSAMTNVDAMSGGAAIPALAALAEEYWQGHLAAYPVTATALGDRRYDHLLDDNSPAGRARERTRLESILARSRAVPEGPLPEADRLTRDALAVEVEGQLAQLDCGLEEWTVDPLFGPQVAFFNVESFQPIRSFAEAQAMVARWRAMGPYLDQHVANLRDGLAARKVAARDPVEKVVSGLAAVLAAPDPTWALLNPSKVAHPDWSPAQRDALREGLAGAARDSVRPALERYHRFLAGEVLPRARPEERAGIAHVPGGEAAYHRLVRVHTTLDVTPQSLHETGLREVERIDEEMAALGARALQAADRAALLRRLRTDPTLHFLTRDEVQAAAAAALARANAAVPRWFGALPVAACEVTRIGEHEEQHTTTAYYRQPAADGSRPGQYFVNTYAPETRPRYEAEVLAYHEAVPGHHLQLALSQELTHLPAFRRHSEVTAYVEGWALYTERLADEMGLYSGDLDRIGMLSYDAWRACRLVVDTGLHALGWSRRRAIDFMLEHTALSEQNIANEVDRYIVWPAQALAYKVGQLELLRLRAEAKQRLGGRFDLTAFHDAVLGNGPLALPALRRALSRFAAGGASNST